MLRPQVAVLVMRLEKLIDAVFPGIALRLTSILGEKNKNMGLILTATNAMRVLSECSPSHPQASKRSALGGTEVLSINADVNFWKPLCGYEA